MASGLGSDGGDAHSVGCRWADPHRVDPFCGAVASLVDMHGSLLVPRGVGVTLKSTTASAAPPLSVAVGSPSVKYENVSSCVLSDRVNNAVSG